MATTLVKAIEILGAMPPGTIWDMPVRVEKRDDLTALVFHAPYAHTTVTVLLSDGDRLDLIKMLGGRKR